MLVEPIPCRFLAAKPDLFSHSSNQGPDFTCRCLTGRSRTSYTLGVRSRLFNPKRTFCLVHVPARPSKDNENHVFLFPRGFGRHLRCSTKRRASFSEPAVNCKVDHVDGPEKNVIMDHLVAVGRQGVVPHLACSGYNHHIAEHSMSPSTSRMRMRRVS